MSIKLLAIETSTEQGSIALSLDGQIFSQTLQASMQNSAWVLEAIDQLLLANGLKKSQLDVISFGCGPGSFTGIRLATSIAQAIAFGLSIPVVPVSTLRALAQQALRVHGCTQVLAALDARLHQMYWGCYQSNPNSQLMDLVGEEGLSDPTKMQWPINVISTWKGVGSGWDRYHHQLTGAWLAEYYPKAYDIAILAAYEYGVSRSITAVEARPVYIRNQVVHSKE